jgi:hypothetical protein
MTVLTTAFTSSAYSYYMERKNEDSVLSNVKSPRSTPTKTTKDEHTTTAPKINVASTVSGQEDKKTL